MLVAIDAHAIGRHLTGNEVYVRSLLNAFAVHNQDREILAYVSGASACAWVPQKIQVRSVAANPFLRLGFDLANRIRKDRPDVLHVQYTAPVGCSIPVVTTVHDVSYLEHPEYFTRDRALQLRLTVGRTVRRAARILTGTEHARNAILRVYPNLEEDKVTVVPLAAAPEFRPISRDGATVTVRERFAISRPFILSVGDMQPRKNHIGLIRAFARLVRAYPQLSHNLVLVGKPTWFSSKVQEAARESGVEDRIQFFGFVSDPDLLQLYNACDCFVFPSFYEGFGFPALEAMACGRAVVCSDASALPEVVDGAAILFDPYAIDEMVRAIADVLIDAQLRARMERLGIQRAAHFSWQKTAQKTLDTFHQVVEQPRAAVGRLASHIMTHR
ncbi:MAG TPA: glycosyltransferase family 1 protein [Bryobacteraceae bacterium]|jgi:glycosyltransferase involved in cell wall biosynthesis|nr:glycosyltransferase family 1 protein [Bryobacteraceae bacterium]